MRRLVLVPAGLLMGFAAAATVLLFGSAVLALAAPAESALALARLLAVLADLSGRGADAMSIVVRAGSRALLWLCLAPLCLVAMVAEAAHLRSLRWLAGGTGALAAAAPAILRALEAGASPTSLSTTEVRLSVLLLLSGVAGGTVFWLFAGRRDAVLL